MAFTMPSKKNVTARYFPWSEFFGIVGSKIFLTSVHELQLVQVKQYETKIAFKQRVLELPVKFGPIFLEKKIPWLEEKKKQKGLVAPAHKRGIKKTQKSIEASKKKLGM